MAGAGPTMRETSTSTATSERVAPPSRWTSPVLQASVSGFVGAVIIASTAPVWRNANPTWRFTLPFVSHPGGALFSASSFVIGVLCIGFGWFRLSGYARTKAIAESVRIRVSAQVMALWAVPIMLGPPLLSNDVYSYAAQGEIGSRGLDPTVVGPWALGGGRFWRAADDVWHYNPSPYGPVWNKLAAGVVAVTGHDPALAVWGFRLVIVAAVALAGWATVRIARQLGADPAVALVLAIGNPLVLLHFVGGAHNDGLMMALLLVGLWLARDRRRVLALVALAAAVAIKLPAVVGLAYLGWTWIEPQRSWFKRAAAAGCVTVVGFALVMAVSVQFHMSQGWVTALKGTGKVKSTFAPATMSGLLATDVLHWFHFDVNEDTVINVFRAGGLLLAAAIGWVILSRASRLGTELAVGLTLFLTVMLGPVLWPWYMPPAVALIAVRGVERIRPALSVWCVALALFVFPVSVGTGVGFGTFQALLGTFILLGITAASMVAQWLLGEPVLPPSLHARWVRRRDERHTLDLVETRAAIAG
jgi:Glycosyltransferase family 87